MRKREDKGEGGEGKISRGRENKKTSMENEVEAGTRREKNGQGGRTREKEA